MIVQAGLTITIVLAVKTSRISFIEDPKMAGIADHQISNQLPVVADFNGDGKDDLYIASAIHSKAQ